MRATARAGTRVLQRAVQAGGAGCAAFLGAQVRPLVVVTLLHLLLYLLHPTAAARPGAAACWVVVVLACLQCHVRLPITQPQQTASFSGNTPSWRLPVDEGEAGGAACSSSATSAHFTLAPLPASRSRLGGCSSSSSMSGLWPSAPGSGSCVSGLLQRGARARGALVPAEHTHACTPHACMHAPTHPLANACATRMHARTHARTHACTHAHKHARTHAHTYARTHACTHTRAHART